MPKGGDSGIRKQRKYEVACRLQKCIVPFLRKKNCIEQLLERDQQQYGMAHVM
jgi:hypothetical protein